MRVEKDGYEGYTFKKKLRKNYIVLWTYRTTKAKYDMKCDCHSGREVIYNVQL